MKEAFKLTEEILSSKYVSLDFETIEDDDFKGIGYEAKPRGASLGWICGEEYRSEYWSFDFGMKSTYNPVSWEWFEATLLRPIWNDKEKHLIFHNGKYDIAVAIRRMFEYPLAVERVWDCLPKSRIEDTMVMAFLADENLPKGLKEQSAVRLNKPRATYEEVKKEFNSHIKLGELAIKHYAKIAWSVYKEKRRKSELAEEPLPPNCTRLEAVALSAMPGMKKEDFIRFFLSNTEEKIRLKYKTEADNKFAAYAKEDAQDTIRLFGILYNQLSKNPEILDWYYKYELPFALLQIEVEVGGVHIDRKYIYGMRDRVEALEKEKEAYCIAEAEKLGVKDFNPRSSPQVQDFIWNVLKLTPPKWARKGKNGNISTKSDVKKYLAEQNPFCQALVEMGATANLKRTFIEPICRRLERSADDLIRTNNQSVGEVTGRVKSSSPNLQNQTNSDKMPTMKKSDGPVPEGWEEHPKKKGVLILSPLRRAFVAPPGWLLWVIDFSQIELRYIAHISQDPVLLHAYCHWDCECGASGELTVARHTCPVCGRPDGERDKEKPDQPVKHGFCLGLDIHALTAVRLGIYPGLSLKEARKLAKTMNFMLCYKGTIFRLAKELNVSDERASQLYYAYFETYAGIAAWHRQVEKDFYAKGYFPYVLGGRYRRFFVQRDLIQKNLVDDVDGIMRQAINSIPQGSAADNYKLAMNLWHYRKMDDPKMRHQKLMLQIHDEAVGCCHEDVGPAAFEMIRDSMEHVVHLSVPIIANGKLCRTWDEGKD